RSGFTRVKRPFTRSSSTISVNQRKRQSTTHYKRSLLIEHGSRDFAAHTSGAVEANFQQLNSRFKPYSSKMTAPTWTSFRIMDGGVSSVSRRLETTTQQSCGYCV